MPSSSKKNSGSLHFIDLKANCHCSNCSDLGECLSRGDCLEGYGADNCMLYDVIKMQADRNASIYPSNSTKISETRLVSFGSNTLLPLIYNILNHIKILQ